MANVDCALHRDVVGLAKLIRMCLAHTKHRQLQGGGLLCALTRGDFKSRTSYYEIIYISAAQSRPRSPAAPALPAAIPAGVPAATRARWQRTLDDGCIAAVRLLDEKIFHSIPAVEVMGLCETESKLTSHQNQQDSGDLILRCHTLSSDTYSS